VWNKKENYLSMVLFVCSTDVWGEAVSEFIWCWTKGSIKIYTRDEKVAEQAMKKGLLVMGVRAPSRVIKGKTI